MALIHRINIPGAEIALWHITESVEELGSLCSDLQREYAASLKNVRRQKEWLAWHCLLRELVTNADTCYDEQGAPLLVGDSRFLSVSHCNDYVAVMVGEAPCGIDIESSERDFSRVVERILSSSERKFSSQGGIIWVAKEAAFKAAHRSGVDFAKDLIIESIDEKNSVISMNMFGESAEVKFMTIEKLFLCYLLKK